MKTKKRATRKSSPKPKYIIALSILMTRSLNELEALNLYGETCLHSTISTLWNNKGIDFHRVYEPHQHQGGGTTKFVRYTLKENYRTKASILLNHFDVAVAA